MESQTDPAVESEEPRTIGLADLVIEDLAAEGAELRARIRDIEADVITYRDLLQAALAVTADLTRERDRLRASYHALLDERRKQQVGTASDVAEQTRAA